MRPVGLAALLVVMGAPPQEIPAQAPEIRYEKDIRPTARAGFPAWASEAAVSFKRVL